MRAHRKFIKCFPALWLPGQAGRLESRMMPLQMYPPARVSLSGVLRWGAR